MPQPVYEFIKAPKLASWDQASLIAFEGVVATVKGSAEPAVLNTLATYVLKKRVEDVNDTGILAQVQQHCRFLKNAFIPDLTTLFQKSLKMDMQVDDCDARVFQYFQSFTKIVEDNGLQALIGSGHTASQGYRYKDRMKARCADNIQPIMLKEQIERLSKFERQDCKTNDATPFDLILEHARVQQRFHVQSVERVAPPVRGQLQHQHQSKRNQKSLKVVAPAAEKKTRAPRRDGCLGPYDDSTSLQVLNVNLDVKVLATPLSVYLADGRHVDYAEQVTVVFELVTGAGPVHMRDVQCLVLECDVEEQLLGNDPMKSLSIDVEGMIEQLAGPSLLTEEKAEFPIGDSLPSAVEDDEDVCDSDGTLACLEDTAVDNGLDVKFVSQLRSLGREYGDIFRENLGDTPPPLRS
ncbi:hypothetical protein PC111_g20242 [Phytophthora cactorum]|nr:hypothetical protein PC111_g20242 [Phytophthora cactorum]